MDERFKQEFAKIAAEVEENERRKALRPRRSREWLWIGLAAVAMAAIAAGWFHSPESEESADVAAPAAVAAVEPVVFDPSLIRIVRAEAVTHGYKVTIENGTIARLYEVEVECAVEGTEPTGDDLHHLGYVFAKTTDTYLFRADTGGRTGPAICTIDDYEHERSDVVKANLGRT